MASKKKEETKKRTATKAAAPGKKGAPAKKATAAKKAAPAKKAPAKSAPAKKSSAKGVAAKGVTAKKSVAGKAKLKSGQASKRASTGRSAPGALEGMQLGEVTLVNGVLTIVYAGDAPSVEVDRLLSEGREVVLVFKMKQDSGAVRSLLAANTLDALEAYLDSHAIDKIGGGATCCPQC